MQTVASFAILTMNPLKNTKGSVVDCWTYNFEIKNSAGTKESCLEQIKGSKNKKQKTVEDVRERT